MVSVSVSLTLFVLLFVAATVNCEDVGCKKGTRAASVQLNPGDSFSFKTVNNRRNKYRGNQRCTASYSLSGGCEAALITCATFNTRSNADCTTGDYLIGKDSNGEEVVRFCNKDGPQDLEVDQDFSMTFVSDRRKSAEGIDCVVSCVTEPLSTTEASTAETTSTASSSTATFPTTTTEGTTAAPVTTTAGPGVTGGPVSTSYSQAWLRGPGDVIAHAHEGIQLADKSGYVAVGNSETSFVCSRVDNQGNKVWTTTIGSKYSIGQAVLQVGDKLYLGGGLNDGSSMKATLFILNVADGSTVKTTSASHANHGSIRGLAINGNTVVGTGYAGNADSGFVFIADSDGAKAMVWKFDLAGNLLESKDLGVEGMQQGTKIRVDPVRGGYVIGSTAWTETGDQQTVVVKLKENLDFEWSQFYGLSSGMDQCFDILVDRDGNYLLGGHTTAGVINWDYLAIKVDGNTKQELWRRTYGQPRGFDARYIHDEMYGVALDAAGNYLLLGGSGDEYTYSATDPATGWKSDIWVSYLVVVSPSGETLSSGVYGSKEGNEAGEYLFYTAEGNIMIFTDSDTVPGMGFLLLTPN